MHKRKEFKEEETQTVADSIPRTQQPAKSSAGYFFESALDRFLLLVNCHRLQPKPQLVLNRNPQATMTWTFRKRGPINLHATKLTDQSYGESTNPAIFHHVAIAVQRQRSKQGNCQEPSRNIMSWADQGAWTGPGPSEGNDWACQQAKEQSNSS